MPGAVVVCGGAAVVPVGRVGGRRSVDEAEEPTEAVGDATGPGSSEELRLLE